MNLQRKTRQIQRGDIYCADLSPVVGSEQGGNRPVLVIQNNTGNHRDKTTEQHAPDKQTRGDGFTTGKHLADNNQHPNHEKRQDAFFSAVMRYSHRLTVSATGAV